MGTADGLEFGVVDSWHNPVEVIPWSELEAIARAVPDEVLEQLVEFRARWRQHQSAYPRFTASAGGEPLTARQEFFTVYEGDSDGLPQARVGDKQSHDFSAD